MEDFNLDDQLEKQSELEGQPESEETEEVLEAVEAEEAEEEFAGIDSDLLDEAQEEQAQMDKKARIERSRLLKAASGFFRKGDYAKSESFYRQAMVYGDEDGTIEEGLWASRTENYTSYACLYELKTANAFAVARESIRNAILEKFGDEMREERDVCQAEAAPLVEKVRAGQNERHEAFVENRNYYLVRFGISFLVLVLFGIGCAVSSNFIYAGGAAGPVLTVVFAILAVIALTVSLIFGLKLLLAQRLIMRNAKLSSTDEGARLEQLYVRAYALTVVLGDFEEDSAEEEIPMSEEE